jgi:hypothetical protein
VAINPDRPAALRLADLGHTDVGETLDDMKLRAEHRHLEHGKDYIIWSGAGPFQPGRSECTLGG